MEIHPTPTHKEHHKCLSCGNHFQGKYCNVCGEKIIEEDERKIKHFLGNLISAFTFADSKFLKSFWALLIKPGQISQDWAKGKRIMWMRPISMFFLINFIYFLIPILQTFNTPYQYQVKGQNYSRISMKMAEEKADDLNITNEELQIRYDAKSSNTAKLLIIYFIIFLSIFLALFLFLKKRYYSDHLLFALEWGSFNLLYNTIFLGVITYILVRITESFGMSTESIISDQSLTIMALIGNSYFLFRAGSKFYNLKIWSSIGFVFLGIFILAIALNSYRALLFLVVLATIR